MLRPSIGAEMSSCALHAGRLVCAYDVVAGLDEPTRRWTDGLRALVKKSDEAERTRKKPTNPLARRRPDGDDIAARIATVPASRSCRPTRSTSS